MISLQLILFIVFLTCYLCNSGTDDQPSAAVTVEYRKSGTELDDDVQNSEGGDELGAQGGSAPSTHQGHDAFSPQGSRSGAKATLPPMKAKTAPETSEETRTKEQETKQRTKSKQGKG